MLLVTETVTNRIVSFENPWKDGRFASRKSMGNHYPPPPSIPDTTVVAWEHGQQEYDDRNVTKYTKVDVM